MTLYELIERARVIGFRLQGCSEVGSGFRREGEAARNLREPAGGTGQGSHLPYGPCSISREMSQVPAMLHEPGGNGFLLRAYPGGYVKNLDL